jgi:hypothetical protein
MRWSHWLWATVTGVCVLSPGIGRADGLFYLLPEDGSWVRFESQYTFRIDGMERVGEGKGTITMASVGKVLDGTEPCRWIEFKVRLKDVGPEQILIRKLLIPEKYLKRGVNPTEHVVRGWAKFNDEAVARAVPVHGYWPAYLAGPLQDERKLDEQLVESKLGALKCEGVTGWIQYQEGDLHMKATFETRLHERAPFGVVSSRLQFELKRDGKIQRTIDATAKLIDFGTGATTALPDHK